jgi:hypothetical protein
MVRERARVELCSGMGESPPPRRLIELERRSPPAGEPRRHGGEGSVFPPVFAPNHRFPPRSRGPICQTRFSGLRNGLARLFWS